METATNRQNHSGSERQDWVPHHETKPLSLPELRSDTLSTDQSPNSSEDDGNVNHEADLEHSDELSDGEDDGARNTIGVSIGHAQTRLTSPRTPAVEKAAMMDRAGGFFEEVDLPGTVDERGEDDDEIHRGHSQVAHSNSAPLTGRQGEQRQSKDSKSKSGGLLNGLSFGRRRAATLETMFDGWHRAIMSNLPLARKSSSGSISGSNTQRENGIEERSQPRTPDRAARRRADSVGNAHRTARTDSPGEAEEARQGVGDLPTRPQLQPIRSRPGVLRRTTSEGSLVTNRTLSRVSSLGDDSRFDDVRDQVNSRFKAIKDTWQDSSMRFSNIPKSLSVANLTPDFLREHSSNLPGRKQSGASQGLFNSRSSISSASMKPKRPEDPMTRQPYASAKDMAHDAVPSKHATHPEFHRALENLEGDIVILGGYRGSILRSAEPPHRQLWVPVKVGLNIRKVNLEVGIDEGSDERATDTVVPGGMLTHIGPVDIARRLFKRLRSCENARTGKLRVHDYGYDWRLDPNHLSRQLVDFLRSLPCNQPGVSKEKRGATVIAHSLGGLITRHAVNQEPQLFKGVVYAGVPKACVNILGPLRNGDEVLLSSRVLTAQVNFSIRTSFALLPLDGRCFIDKDTKEEYPVDFFDPQTWIDYRLSPCVARPLPPLAPAEKPSGLTGYVTSLTESLPSLPALPLPGRNKTNERSTRSKSPGFVEDVKKATSAYGAAEPDAAGLQQATSDDIVADGNVSTANGSLSAAEEDPSSTSSSHISPRTAVTIPREAALSYLTRTLASVKSFKQALAFHQPHSASNSYPPIAAIYGKSVPTVYGAKVAGCEAIKHADAYDELAFASGDGVVLARAAMLPEGYKAARGGVVSSERGHVTLLGDLEAVGKCLNAVIAARERGVGVGRAEG